MKKFLIGAAVAALATTSAHAAPFGDLDAFRDQANDLNTTAADKTIAFEIGGSLPEECDAAVFGVTGTSVERLSNTEDLSNLQAGELLSAGSGQPGNASLDVICNFAGAALITVTGAGALSNGNETIPYTVVSGWDGLDGADLSAGPATHIANELSGPLDSTGRSFNVRLDATPTVAGTYTDTITIAVAPA